MSIFYLCIHFFVFFVYSNVNMWIGCNDLTSTGSFVWIHNNQSVSFTNWQEGEPNNGGQVYIEHCCMIGYFKKGLWNDFPCDYNLKFICKKQVGN